MSITFGNKKLIGQQRAKEQIQKVLNSDRISHAYLISGAAGVGKTACALAFAEWINGISHISDLGEATTSRKSSWYNHPDIHVFIPKPTTVSFSEVRERLDLLAKDPYEIIDFSQRPSLTDDSSSKNRQSFYPVDYYREEIRPAALLRPNEGKRTVVILTQVETMRKETANAFLKLLEEPSDRLMFILTTEHYDRLLPTITSRCQHIPLAPLTEEEITHGLQSIDGYSREDAAYLARMASGNYALTRFYDIDTLKKNRERIVDFLRLSYSQDALAITQLVQEWQSSNNIEGLLSIVSIMETYLRDLLIFKTSGRTDLLTNIDQAASIQKFTTAMKEAKLEHMLEELTAIRPLLRQNVSPKLIFTVLSLRFFNLIRGSDPTVSENWQHLPAFVH